MEICITKVKEERIADRVALHFRESSNLENFYSQFGFTDLRKAGKYSNGETKYQMNLKI